MPPVAAPPLGGQMFDLNSLRALLQQQMAAMFRNRPALPSYAGARGPAGPLPTPPAPQAMMNRQQLMAGMWQPRAGVPAPPAGAPMTQAPAQPPAVAPLQPRPAPVEAPLPPAVTPAAPAAPSQPFPTTITEALSGGSLEGVIGAGAQLALNPVNPDAYSQLLPAPREPRRIPF